MKILIVTPSFYPAYVYGGPIEATKQLALAWIELGHTVRVLTTNANGKGVLSESDLAGKEISGLLINYKKRNFGSSTSLGLLRSLPWEIRNADLIHLNAVYSFPVVPTILLARFFKKPIVWSPHGALQKWGGTRKRLLKRVWDITCRIILPRNAVFQFTAESEKAESLKNFGETRSLISSNGIHVPDFVPDKTRSKILRCLYLGRVSRKKGLENLISAFRYLPKEEFTLDVFGGGIEGYVSELKKLVSTNNVSDRVSFKGIIDHDKIGEVFANHDVLILSSYKENFGNVVTEALSFGVPVIVSKGAPWSGIEREGCGLWIENDPESIAQAVKKISTMPLEEMGIRGREWVVKEFNWIDQADKIIVFAERELLKESIA